MPANLIINMSAGDEKCCVILVNYNGAEDTIACLTSLQQSSVPVRVVVVDNTPDDPDLSKALDSYPDVKLIRAPENLGFGRGNNLGLRWALENTNCKYLFFLNNDTIIQSEAISKLETALDNFPEAGMVVPRIVFKDNPEVLWYGGGEVSWLRGAAKTPGMMGPSNAELALQARHVSFATGCAILVRRELMEILGGFDERFFMYEEDLELCLRVQELGWKIRYEPEALILHVVQASSRGGQGFVGPLSPLNNNLSFYAYHLVRNRLINMHLHAKGKNRLVFIVGFSLLILKKTIVFALHKRWDGISAMSKGWSSYRDCFANGNNKI